LHLVDAFKNVLKVPHLWCYLCLSPVTTAETSKLFFWLPDLSFQKPSFILKSIFINTYYSYRGFHCDISVYACNVLWLALPPPSLSLSPPLSPHHFKMFTICFIVLFHIKLSFSFQIWFCNSSTWNPLITPHNLRDNESCLLQKVLPDLILIWFLLAFLDVFNIY
jgi:hypothetical protein